MKKAELTITFPAERLRALKRYMSKRELDLGSELSESVAKLYEKYVPAAVREYIDDEDITEPEVPKPRRPVKPFTPTLSSDDTAE